MTKTILLSVAWLAVGCHSRHLPQRSASDCIKSIIQTDDQLGRVRNHACEKISLSETIDNYAKGLCELNFNQCPPAFKTAFQKHRQAWLDTKAVTNRYPTLRGEMHDLFRRLETEKDSTEFKRLQKGIWDTWSEIEKAMRE